MPATHERSRAWPAPTPLKLHNNAASAKTPARWNPFARLLAGGTAQQHNNANPAVGVVP